MRDSAFNYIRLAAEGAYRAFVHRRAAVRALALQKLPAHCAVNAANRIRRVSVRKKQPHLFHEILMVRRATRIRAESLRMRNRERGTGNRGRVCYVVGGNFRNREIELLRNLVDDFIVQLSTVTLLEHGKSRLLAADFGRKLALSKPGLSPRRSHAFAELYTKVFHNADIMDFIL